MSPNSLALDLSSGIASLAFYPNTAYICHGPQVQTRTTKARAPPWGGPSTWLSSKSDVPKLSQPGGFRGCHFSAAFRRLWQRRHGHRQHEHWRRRRLEHRQRRLFGGFGKGGFRGGGIASYPMWLSPSSAAFRRLWRRRHGRLSE